MFDALILNQEDKKIIATLEQIDESRLPEGDVLIDVDYSSLNYKDGLAITGKGKICRQFPMVPGIDFTGTVLQSENPQYQIGDAVVLTGWGVGESHWGGMAKRARVQSKWLVPLPKNLTHVQAMQIGTAGLTAMLCVQALQNAGITPDKGEIVVTGASGGVGSIAVILLAQLGYQVVAVTGRVEENKTWLQSLGATEVVSRETFSMPCRPLEKQRWAGAIDTVGSQILANILAQMDYDGAVAACGLAGGFDLPTSVMPFILRGVKLLGIDSVYISYERRQKAWQEIAQLLPASYFEQNNQEITLSQVIQAADEMMAGQVRGRLVIKI